MSTSFTPVWTDNVEVCAPYALIKGESYRVTFDLRNKIEARLQIGVGFGGSTDLTNGVDVKLYRMLNNDGNSIQFGAPIQQFRTTIDPGVCLVNVGGTAAVGTSSIAYSSGTGRAFVAGDTLCFWGETTVPVVSGAIATPTVEFIRAGKAAATPFLLDTPTKYEHSDTEIIALANSWNVWLAGGSTYALVFDYLDDAAGEAVCCAASMQTHDSDVGTSS